MTEAAPESVPPAAVEPPPTAVPRWVRWADVVTALAVLIVLSNLLFDGFRLKLGEVRLTATTPIRTLVLALIVAAIRHWLCRQPAIHQRAWLGLQGVWRSEARRVVLPAFLWSRSMVLVVGFLAVVLVGYAEHAPPIRISRNELVNLPMRWDAGWYLQIALDGYDYRDSAAQRQQNIAFFPAYPLLVRVGAAWLGSRSTGARDELHGNRIEWQYFQHRRIVASAMIVSLGAFAWALVYLFRLAREILDVDAARGAVVLACAYPYALFFSAMYTESLFLLVTVASFYHFRRDELVRASVWGLLAGLTRPNGCLLSIPLAVLALQRAYTARREGHGIASRQLVAGLAAAAMPGIGMLLFSAFLFQLTGRPLAWMDAHRAWGRVATNVEALIADRMTFIVDQGIYTYSVSQPVEILNAAPTLLALLLVIPIVRRLGLAYGLLIVLMVVPPLLRGGFLSLGRVTATLFPLFLLAGEQLRGSSRSTLVIAMAGLQAFLAVLFFTWRPFY